MKKINSINFAVPWIFIGLIMGLFIPIVIYFCFHVFFWPLCFAGGIILLSFAVVFAMEMHQDFAEIPFYKKHLAETIPFDREKQEAVIKCSICTGEQTACFKDKTDGKLTEVMLIKTEKDMEYFMKIYNIETIKKEY